jgi:[acyl-carrier-protein] S-malonyltransferase
MAAILGLDAAAVIEGCAEAAALVGEPVEAANFNDPKQTVIAGTKAAVDKACEVLKAKGAKRALLLPVSAPFHSSLMRPAAEQLKVRLADTDLKAPQIPLINNIDVAVQTDPQAIREALYRQSFGAVRWVETIQAFHARGIAYIVECGPGKVLAGMVRRIEPDATGLAMFDPAGLTEAKGLLS